MQEKKKKPNRSNPSAGLLRKSLLLALFCGMLQATGFSQLGLQAEGFSFVDKKPLSLIPQVDLNFLSHTAALPSFPKAAADLKNRMTATKAYNYCDHLAFFCRIEVKLDKKVDIPLRLRLGTVDYVDRLEQKRSDY